MDYGIEGRVALVAASSKGLGKACAMGLAREGAKVALCARSDGDLQKAAQEIQSATGAEVFAQPADMSKPGDIESVIGAARDHFGRIDILVTNAGGPPPGQFMDFTDDDWLAALNLNLLSTIRMIRGVMPQMQAQRWGRIVNITSVTVKQPFEQLLLSNVSRAGVVTLSKTLSNQLAKDNVLINTVCPGIILTDRVRQVTHNMAETQGISEDEALQAYVSPIPMGRAGQPAEFADLVVFSELGTLQLHDRHRHPDRRGVREGVLLSRHGLQQHGVEQRQHDLVMPGEGIAAAAVLGWAPHHVGVRAVVLQHVQVDGDEALDRVPGVAAQGQCLEEHFRQEHGGADVPITAAVVQAAQQQGEALKIRIGRGAEQGGVGTGMHVDGVGADGHVHRNRHLAGMRGSEKAVSLVRVTPFGNRSPHDGADSDSARVVRSQGVVDQARGFLHHAERPGAETLRHVFGGLADQRNFEVVNDTGTVQDEAAQPAALHHVDEDGVEPALDDVGAHGEDDGSPALMRGHETVDDVGDFQALQQTRKQRTQIAAGLPCLRVDEIGDVHFVLPIAHRDGADPLQGLQILWRHWLNRRAGHVGIAPSNRIMRRCGCGHYSNTAASNMQMRRSD